MKWRMMLTILMIGVFFSGVSFAGTATITYTEPTQTQAGNTLSNLKQTTIYLKQDALAEQAIIVPATAVGGGGAITKTVTINDPPPCGKTTITVQASATNLAGSEGPRSTAVSATKDLSTAAGCANPKSPFNITITIN